MYNKGFNWTTFAFAPFYYAGYGKFGTGLLFALLEFIPLAFIPVHLYAGFKANSDLPVGKTPFNWGVITVPAVVVIIIIISNPPTVNFTSEEPETTANKQIEANMKLAPKSHRRSLRAWLRELEAKAEQKVEAKKQADAEKDITDNVDKVKS